MENAKYFRKREAILTCLRRTKEHPGAEWIHDRVRAEYPDISLGTVYRNLTLFREQGLIQSIGTVRGVERFDGNPEPHVHFICTGCGKVLDLDGVPVPAELTGAAEAETGGRVDACRLNFTGTCSDCTKNTIN